MWGKSRRRTADVESYTRLIPPSGKLDDYLRRIAEHRGRKIELMTLPADTAGLTGLWAATAENDYIVYPSGAGPTHRATVICHELAHMALGHEPDDDESLVELMRTIAPSIDPSIALRMFARHAAHDHPDEIAAERLSTRLVTDLHRAAAKSSWGGVFQRLH